ncbi:MAG TPA: ribosomal protein S18-alanine N-acetyltransferase [Anaerolineae bacterium]|nr:ribosomal protein S18-alanine N-acetyltransferase [Anaerolineae bacterium]
MSQPALPFSVEPMTLADIPAVVAIEYASYSMTWPARAYDYELQYNDLAHYFVLRTSLPQPPLEESRQSSRQPEVQERIISGQRSAVSGRFSTIIGLAGFWLMVDEAHISTIAIHPDWRGLGLGEWLLLSLIETAQTLQAQTATLEVRPSNQIALALYQKYHFEQVGLRPRYYSDNDEDALILTTPPFTSLDYQAMLAQRRKALLQRLANLT